MKNKIPSPKMYVMDTSKDHTADMPDLPAFTLPSQRMSENQVHTARLKNRNKNSIYDTK